MFWPYILSLSKGKSSGTHVNDENLEPLSRGNEWEKIDIDVFTGKSELKDLQQKQLRLQELHSDGFKLGYSENPGTYSKLESSEDEDEDEDSEDSDEYFDEYLDEDSDEDSKLEGSNLNYPGRVPSHLRLMDYLD